MCKCIFSHVHCLVYQNIINIKQAQVLISISISVSVRMQQLGNRNNVTSTKGVDTNSSSQQIVIKSINIKQANCRNKTVQQQSMNIHDDGKVQQMNANQRIIKLKQIQKFMSGNSNYRSNVEYFKSKIMENNTQYITNITMTIQNILQDDQYDPFSKLLALRFIREVLVSGCNSYGFITMLNSVLASYVLFQITSYNNNKKDDGQSMFLNCRYKQYDEQYVRRLGVSVYKIVVQMYECLSQVLPILPYQYTSNENSIIQNIPTIFALKYAQMKQTHNVKNIESRTYYRAKQQNKIKQSFRLQQLKILPQIRKFYKQLLNNIIIINECSEQKYAVDLLVFRIVVNIVKSGDVYVVAQIIKCLISFINNFHSKSANVMPIIQIIVSQMLKTAQIQTIMRVQYQIMPQILRYICNTNKQKQYHITGESAVNDYDIVLKWAQIMKQIQYDGYIYPQIIKKNTNKSVITSYAEQLQSFQKRYNMSQVRHMNNIKLKIMQYYINNMKQNKHSMLQQIANMLHLLDNDHQNNYKNDIKNHDVYSSKLISQQQFSLQPQQQKYDQKTPISTFHTSPKMSSRFYKLRINKQQKFNKSQELSINNNYYTKQSSNDQPHVNNLMQKYPIMIQNGKINSQSSSVHQYQLNSNSRDVSVRQPIMLGRNNSKNKSRNSSSSKISSNNHSQINDTHYRRYNSTANRSSLKLQHDNNKGDSIKQQKTNEMQNQLQIYKQRQKILQQQLAKKDKIIMKLQSQTQISPMSFTQVLSSPSPEYVQTPKRSKVNRISSHQVTPFSIKQNSAKSEYSKNIQKSSFGSSNSQTIYSNENKQMYKLKKNILKRKVLVLKNHNLQVGLITHLKCSNNISTQIFLQIFITPFTNLYNIIGTLKSKTKWLRLQTSRAHIETKQKASIQCQIIFKYYLNGIIQYADAHNMFEFPQLQLSYTQSPYATSENQADKNIHNILLPISINKLAQNIKIKDKQIEEITNIQKMMSENKNMLSQMVKIIELDYRICSNYQQFCKYFAQGKRIDNDSKKYVAKLSVNNIQFYLIMKILKKNQAITKILPQKINQVSQSSQNSQKLLKIFLSMYSQVFSE